MERFGLGMSVGRRRLPSGVGMSTAMDVKRSHPGKCIELHRLMEAVLKLRQQVARLEKVQSMDMLEPHSGLNFSASPRTNANGRRTRKAGVTRKAP